MKQVILAFTMAFAATSSQAGENTIIDDWYDALKTSDRAAFGEILHDDAIIELDALGITQNKTEFIEALDNWEGAAKDLELSYTYEGVDATSATAEVCYRFPSNAFTNLEIFTVIDGRITRQSQEKMRDGC